MPRLQRRSFERSGPGSQLSASGGSTSSTWTRPRSAGSSSSRAGAGRRTSPDRRHRKLPEPPCRVRDLGPAPRRDGRWDRARHRARRRLRDPARPRRLGCRATRPGTRSSSPAPASSGLPPRSTTSGSSPRSCSPTSSTRPPRSAGSVIAPGGRSCSSTTTAFGPSSTATDGREIGTTGDGFLALFDGAARAVRAASAMSPAVADLGIAIRAGSHTGEVGIAGGQARGLAVHAAARVAALAGPGEVLVSATTRDLLDGSDLRSWIAASTSSRAWSALAGSMPWPCLGLTPSFEDPSPTGAGRLPRRSRPWSDWCSHGGSLA